MTEGPALGPVAVFIGHVSRPLSILITSIAASVATIMVAMRTENGNDAAILMAAVYAGVAALYIGKAVETARIARSEADVKIAQSGSPQA